MLHKVQRRGGFSDRNGINALNTEMQYKSFDERTRNAVINWAIDWYDYLYGDVQYYYDGPQDFFKFIISDTYGEVVDTRVINDGHFWNMIKETISNDDYDAVLTVAEAIAQYFANEDGSRKPYHELNQVFEKEYVGYRFIGKEITPITDDNEIEAIKEVYNSPYQNVSDHIHKAVLLLSDRDNPDYENSIKESISAVEAMCSIILGEKDTLGAALKKLEKNGVSIHPSMKTAFEKLYGYTSDAHGIRHAGEIGGPASTFDEAKFMLVSCSAFANYLKSVM